MNCFISYIGATQADETLSAMDSTMIYPALNVHLFHHIKHYGVASVPRNNNHNIKTNLKKAFFEVTSLVTLAACCKLLIPHKISQLHMLF